MLLVQGVGQWLRSLAPVVLFLLLAVPASAADYSPATPLEIAQMPDFCQAKIGGKEHAGKDVAWKQRFGETWLHMHHYCYGLKDMQRSLRSGNSKLDRKFYLESAIQNFQYVLSRAPPGFWFASQIHLQKAAAYSRLGRSAEAAAEYQRARNVSAPPPAQ